MNLPIKNHLWLLASIVALLAAISAVAIVIYRDRVSDAKPDNTQQMGESSTNMSAPTQTDNKDFSSLVISNQETASETDSAEMNNTALPPISIEVANEIRRLSNHTAEGLVEVKNADGSVSMELEGHFQSVTAAVRGADGKIIIRHGEDFLSNVQSNNRPAQP